MEFNKIVESLLNGYEQGGFQDVDSLLKRKGQELGLSEESMNKICQTSAIIDRLAQNMDSLQEAKREGHSLKQWMMDRLEKSLEPLEEGEAKDKLLGLLTEKAETLLDNQQITK